MVDKIFWLLAYVLVHMLFDFKVTRLATDPEPRQAIYIANHVSSLDWLIIKAAFPKQLSFIAHHSFVELPFWGTFLRLVKCIPIGSDLGVLRRALRLTNKQLEQGRSVCIFPEGGLTRNGKMHPFKRGIVKLALKHQSIPLVPLTLNGLWGTTWSLEGGWFWEKRPQFRRPTIELVVAKQINPKVLHFVESKERFLFHSVQRHYKVKV